MRKKISAEELAVLESGVEGQPITRVQALENELKDVEAEKKMLEIEKGLHHLMEEIHPSKRARAAKLLKSTLGGVRGTPEGRAKRRELLKKGIGEVVQMLRERKAQQEGFKVPTKYYENVLGRGWVVGKTERKHVHHRKKHITAKRRAKYRSSDYSSFFEPMERYEPRMMPYPRPRRRIYYGR